MNYEDMKRVLFKEIVGNKYNREILINVYVKDPDFVRKMLKEEKCFQAVTDFLKSNIKEITKIYDKI